jgi:hypothetical protein
MSKKSALRKELLLMRIRVANSRFYLTEMSNHKHDQNEQVGNLYGGVGGLVSPGLSLSGDVT